MKYHIEETKEKYVAEYLLVKDKTVVEATTKVFYNEQPA